MLYCTDAGTETNADTGANTDAHARETDPSIARSGCPSYPNAYSHAAAIESDPYLSHYGRAANADTNTLNGATDAAAEQSVKNKNICDSAYPREIRDD